MCTDPQRVPYNRGGKGAVDKPFVYLVDLEPVVDISWDKKGILQKLGCTEKDHLQASRRMTAEKDGPQVAAVIQVGAFAAAPVFCCDHSDYYPIA